MPVYHRRRRHGFRFWSATVPVSCMIEPPTSPFLWSHLDDLAIAPFTLRRWLQDGRVRRVLRGVYVSSLLPDTLEMRARCAALVLPTDAVLCDRSRSEEHTSELQSLMRISYAVFCLKKKKKSKTRNKATKNKRP